MKKTLTAIGLIFLFSCNDSKKETPLPKEERQSIAAMYLFGGKVEVGFLYRIIQVNTKEDSVTKKINLTIDTIWGIPRLFNKVGSDGKPLIDSITKNPIMEERAIQISKDSLEWKIENKDLPTLAKERFPNIKQ